jgi:hypothetical protein
MPKNQRTKDLETIIVPAIALTALARVFHVRAPDYIALLLLSSSLLLPGTAAYMAGLWLKFGAFLGRINGGILLTAIFCLVLTPAALLRRLLSGGGDKLGLKKDPTAGSYWKTRDHLYIRTDFEKVW